MRRLALLALGAAAFAPLRAHAQSSSARPEITFEAAVARALQHNPVTAEAKAEVLRAQAVVEEVRAAMLPTVSANAVGTQLDAARVQGYTVVQPRSALNGNVQVNVPLVVPQRWAATARAHQAVNVARFGQAETSRQLAYATAQAFLTATLQRRLLENARRAKETAQSHYAYAHQRLVHGVGNRLDEARAEKELSEDLARVETAQAHLSRAEEALGVLVGSDGPLRPAGEVVLPPLPPEDAALRSVKDRSDVRLAQEQLSLSERTVKDNWLDLLPNLNATFQPFVQTPGTATAPDAGWQGTVALSWPLYDGGYRYGVHREREAQRASARARLEARQRQGVSEVRTALEQLASSERAQAEAEKTARVASEVLALATEAYQAGASTSLEVIDAERSARDADAGALIARDGTDQARIDVLVASGRFPSTGDSLSGD